MALLKRQETFFRRLDIVDTDAAGAILNMAGVPRASFIARTHHPTISLPYLRAFDASVVRAWCALADVESPSERTRMLAHMPTALGGCGFTSHELTAANAFNASFEAAMGTSFVDQRSRSLASNVAIQKKLCTDPAMAAHIRETSKKGTATWLHHPDAGKHFGEAAYGAALRHRLRTGHKCLPASSHCPGCHASCTSDEFSAHVAGCARIHGFNVSARHAATKRALDDIFRKAAVPSDGAEPREFGGHCCPGCGATIKEDVAAHISSCKAITVAQRAHGVPSARRIGPDGRCYLGGPPVVFDVTVVSPTAPSYITRAPDTAMSLRKKEKTALYGAAVAAQGEEFVVFGATAFGSLTAESIKLLGRVAAHAPGKVTRHELMGSMATYIALSSGQVIAAAERRVGCVLRNKRPPDRPDAPAAAADPGAPAAAADPDSALLSIATVTQTLQTTSGRATDASENGDAAQ